MLIRFLISIAMMLAPHSERDPLAALHQLTPNNAARCEAGDQRVCNGLAARSRVNRVWNAIQQFADTPDQAAELWRICARESWCGRYGDVGVHERDAHHGEAMWFKAVERGYLHPEECFEHGLMPRSKWAPRGLYATSPAYVLRYLPGCNGPELLDDYEHATVLARDHLRYLDAHGADTCRLHVRAWVGPGKWARWSEAKRTVRTRLQCGEEGAAAVLAAALADSASEDFDALENARYALAAWSK